MHIGQLLAVTAESPEDAIERVTDYANELSWTDWWTFGGRWTNYDLEHGYLLTYDSNPKLFNELVSKFEDYNKEVIRRACRLHDGVTIGSLLMSDRYKSRWVLAREGVDIRETERQMDTDSANAFYEDTSAWLTVSQALDVLLDRHTYEMGFFDIEDYTTNADLLYDRVEKDPSNQYLLIVDFHF
jgi:hypothetical protein